MSLWSRIRNVFDPGSHQNEIREEIEFHLAMDRAHGHDAREARLRLGNPTRIREEVREAGIAAWLESVLQDARYGLRQFRRSPALVVAIVLSLAIGIGANTAIFPLADAALLKPLPVRDPEQLVLHEWSSEGRFAPVQRIGGGVRTVEGGRQQIPTVSEAVYRAFATRQSAFASVIGFSNASPMAFSDGRGIAEQVHGQYVSVNFFSGLGVSPVLGRSFLEEEDRRGQEPPVILSHRYWTSRLGGDRNIVGRSIRVNDTPAAGVPVGGLRARGAGARRHRAGRPARLRCGPPDQRDRGAHGFGGRTSRRPSHGRRRFAADGGAGNPDRPARRLSTV
jgi:hypothetical protein